MFDEVFEGQKYNGSPAGDQANAGPQLQQGTYPAGDMQQLYAEGASTAGVQPWLQQAACSEAASAAGQQARGVCHIMLSSATCRFPSGFSVADVLTSGGMIGASAAVVPTPTACGKNVDHW